MTRTVGRARRLPFCCARLAQSAFLLSVALCVVSAPAAAQPPAGGAAPGQMGPPGRPERPYRGLFGGAVGSTNQLLTLDASAGTSSGWGATQSAQSATGTGGNGEEGAAFGSMNLDYSFSRDKFGMHASNLASLNYYPNVNDGEIRPREVVGGGIYFMPARSTRIDFDARFKNLPEFSLSDMFDPGFGQIIPPNQDIAMSVVRYQWYGFSTDVSHKLTKRSVLAASAGYSHGILPTNEWTNLNASVNYSYSISKGIAGFLGYQTGGQSSPGMPPDNHRRINFGIDYNRPISFTRQTTLSFSTGIAGVRSREDDQNKYDMIGAIHLKHEFGRSWEASAHFNRNVAYIEMYGEPMFSDSLTAMLRGSFSRKVNFTAAYGSTKASIGIVDATNADN